MKKLVWTVCCTLLLCHVAFAADGPIDKGSLMLDGSVSFIAQSGELHESSDGDGYWAISFSPSVGYFVLPGLLLGMEAGFLHSSQGDFYKVDGYHIGPYVGYYFNGNPDKKQARGSIYPFAKGSFGFQRTETTSIYSFWDGWDEYMVEIETTRKELRYEAEAGAVFMVSNAVGINVSGQIISSTVKWDSDAYENSGESLSGLTFLIGAGVTYFVY